MSINILKRLITYKPGSFSRGSLRLFSDLHPLKAVPQESDVESILVALPSPIESYLCAPPNPTLFVTPSQLLHYYSEMSLIRRMDMMADSLYKGKFIRGFCHLNIGQEAIPIGIESVLSPSDALITAYRCHGFAYTRGLSPHSIFAELLGRVTGASKGKGGSMHMYSSQFFGGNGIVGAQVPVGAGLSFQQKYNNVHGLTFTIYGDGASNQGQVYEAFNMAALWKLPVVFVIENNGFGMGTSIARSSASTEYYKRAQYIPGLRVDGMDVLAVRTAALYARDWILNKRNGPILLDLVTYRYSGHSMSDPGTTYRSREEVQAMRETKDPILTLKKVLLEKGVAEEAQIKKMDKEARDFIEKAAQQAKNDPEPSEKDLWADIYAPGTEMTPVKPCDPEYINPY